MTTNQTNQPSSGYSYLMMIGHMCCDMNQSTIPALLPFLIVQHGIDYSAAAGLTFAVSFLSSMIQPLLGILSDRKQMPWLMGLGILLTGLSIGSIGFLNSYWGIFLAGTISGLGSALFHPEGGRMANCVAGEKKGRSMSTFAAGGNVGFIIGPLVVTLTVPVWGLKGTTVVLLPTIIIAIIFFCIQKKFLQLSTMARHKTEEQLALHHQQDDWPSFFKLCLPIFTRSIAQNGLQTFIPLYWVAVLMQSQQRGSMMVTVIAISAATSAFVGGRIADRFGFRRLLRIAFALMAPLAILVLQFKNVGLATVMVILFAAVLQVVHGPSVVLGQKYLPNHLGLASGVTLGLAISMGGICSPLLGKIGDHYGLPTVLYVVAGVALVGFVGTLFLKDPDAPRQDTAPNN